MNRPHPFFPLPALLMSILIMLPGLACAQPKPLYLTADSAPADLALLNRLYAVEIQQSITDHRQRGVQRQPATYQVARVDLNGDGIPDLVVYFNDSAYCGSSGCTVNVWLGLPNGGFRQVMDAVGGPVIYLLGTSTHGYPDLATLGKGYRYWRWSGARYVEVPS